MKTNIYYLAAVAVLNAFAFQYYQEDFALEEVLHDRFMSALNGDRAKDSDLAHIKGDKFALVACDIINVLADCVNEERADLIEDTCELLNMGFFYVEC